MKVVEQEPQTTLVASKTAISHSRLASSRESLNSEGYEVLQESGHLIVKFQNNTGPLSLVLQPNNTLTGSGTIDVTGRKAIQAAGGGVDYTPRNARCSLGTMEAAK